MAPHLFVVAIELPVQIGQTLLRLRQPRNQSHHHADRKEENDEKQNDF